MAPFHVQDSEVAFWTGRHLSPSAVNGSMEIDDVCDLIRLNALPELDPWDLADITPGPQPRPEGRGDLAKDRRRGNDRAPGLAQKGHHPAFALRGSSRMPRRGSASWFVWPGAWARNT